jgi:hypothetical protein
MKLEQQVVSLELAKKLKELGVKQESLFWWEWYSRSPITEKPTEPGLTYGFSYGTNGGCISAFTGAELGEMLPEVVQKVPEFCIDEPETWGLTQERAGNRHRVIYTYYHYEPMESFSEEAETEADARAKMLIYLLENKLI